MEFERERATKKDDSVNRRVKLDERRIDLRKSNWEERAAREREKRRDQRAYEDDGSCDRND